MPWAEVCLCTVLTGYCLLPAVVAWFPEAHEFSGWCLGYDTGVVCLPVWQAQGIGSCDSMGSSRHGAENAKYVLVLTLCSISYISVFINVILKSLCFKTITYFMDMWYWIAFIHSIFCLKKHDLSLQPWEFFLLGTINRLCHNTVEESI